MATKVANDVLTNGNAQPSFTLNVRNLPMELEKDGVANIFMTYGHVTGAVVFKNNNSKQAYISYAKYSEAEDAFNDLNGKPPLNLKIELKEDPTKNHEKKEKIVVDMSNPIPDFRYRDRELDHLGNARKSMGMGKANCSPAFHQANVYTPDDDLLYPVTNDSSHFNPYELPVPYYDTNLMYTRGITHVSRNGRRHIAYGRGYTYYNLPEPHFNMPTYLENICERRKKGLYEYATETTEEDSGNCKVCQSPTAFRCQKCTITFYCSKKCQVNDWNNHKLDCQPIPELVKPLNNTLTNGYQTETIPKEPEREIPQAPLLRRPKMTSRIQQSQYHTEQQDQNENIQLNKELQKSPASVNNRRSSPARSTKSNSSYHRNSDENRNTLNKQSNSNNFQKHPTTLPGKQQIPLAQDSQFQNQRKNNSKMSEDNIVFQEQPSFLPNNEFVNVFISNVLDNGDFYVQKEESALELEHFIEKIQLYADKAQPIEPEENLKCIFKRIDNDTWFRAIIKTVDRVSKIFFPDFGSFMEAENVGKLSVRPLGHFKDVPVFAQRLRLCDNSNDILQIIKDGATMIQVRALRKTGDGVIIVEARPSSEQEEAVAEARVAEQLASCSLNDSKPLRPPTQIVKDEEIVLSKIASLPSVIESLRAGQEGIIFVTAELSKGEYSLSLVPHSCTDDFEKLLRELGEICKAQLKENPNYNCKVGDLVCGNDKEDSWYRGIVTSVRPIIKIALIDEGRILIPFQCIPIPEAYKNILSFGVIIKFLNNTELPNSKLDETGTFKVEEDPKSRDSAMVNLSFDSCSFSANAIVKKWTPRTEQKAILEQQLTSGQEVHVLELCSPNTMYVQSRAPEDVERTHLFTQKVAKYALNRQPLTEMPVVGQMVLSHFIADDNYYRAIVTKVEESLIRIKYVDWGNDETVSLDGLFHLSDDLKEHPSCIAKIKMLGIEDNAALNKEVTDYFANIIGESIPLTCTFEGHPFIDGVILKTGSGENINNTVKRLLKSTWEKNNIENEKRVFQIDDLPSLKLGDVGDQVKAVVLCYYPSNRSIVLGPDDVTAVEAIQVELQEKITQYVEKTKQNYIPRDQELCIAKYDDKYYRALCVASSHSPTESRVYFVDWGNTEVVNHSDIRMMTEDFIKIGAFGTLCSLDVTIPKEKLNDKVAERIGEIAPMNEVVDIKIVSLDDDNITPNVDIPYIRTKLYEEGII